MGSECMNERQKRFVREYLIDLNATKAAIRAGYSQKTANEQGSRLLTNVSIQEAIEKGFKKRSDRTEITQDFVLNGLKEVTERCLQRKPVMFYNKETKQMEQAIDDETGEGVWTFDSGGANRSLELLGKHLGIFKDNLNVNHEFPGAIRFPEKAEIGEPVKLEEEKNKEDKTK